MAVPSNASRPQNKSAMTELKYRRIVDMNQKLRDDFDRPRCKTSDACTNLTSYCKATKDYMVPSVWGAVDKKDDPYAPAAQGGCCNIM